MTAITPALSTMQIEETKFGSAISEYTATKMGAAINYINENAIEPIGTILHSFLTEAQFQSIKGNKWVKIAGQSIVGSDLATLTGITTLPSLVGASLVQTDSDGSISQVSTGDIKTHSHAILNQYGSVSVNGRTTIVTEPFSGSGGTSPIYNATNGTDKFIQDTGGTNNLAAGYKTNIFIKINNENT